MGYVLQVAECHTITSSTPLLPSAAPANGTKEQPSSYPTLGSPDDDGFQEDSLTGALLDRLERLLDQVSGAAHPAVVLCDLLLLLQSYELNLLLTAVLSRLACFTHSLLDDYLFSTTARHHYPRTVYTVLRKVDLAIGCVAVSLVLYRD